VDLARSIGGLDPIAVVRAVHAALIDWPSGGSKPEDKLPQHWSVQVPESEDQIEGAGKLGWSIDRFQVHLQPPDRVDGRLAASGQFLGLTARREVGAR